VLCCAAGDSQVPNHIIFSGPDFFEPFSPDFAGEAIRGLYIKGGRKAARHFTIEDISEDEMSSVHYWVGANVDNGDVVLLAVVGLSAEISGKVFQALSNLGAPQLPEVSDEPQAFAVAGVAGTAQWQARSGQHAACACVLPRK